jgi:hypothetical protein
MSQPSDRMLELLQQISVLKELDAGDRREIKTVASARDSSERRNKSRQIRKEMKELASDARRRLHTKE